MGRLGTESAFEVLARARALEAEGRAIIHLEIGEPDFETPRHIRDAAKAALDAGHTHYVPAPGIMPLREAVAGFLERTGRLRTDPGRVIVTPGAKPIMFFTILALCEEGDEVVLPDPGFPMYESITAFAGARPVPIPLRERNDFRLDPGELASLVTQRTKLLILSSPHNPCGSALTAADLEAIAALALERDLVVLADEVYWAISYDRPHASILDYEGMPERTVLLDGWSKTFAMTGWRLGFGVFPPVLVEPVERMVAELRRRRDVIVDGLNRIPGMRCVRPEGAFYAFPSVADLGRPADEVERLLLRRAGVACLSGTAFGSGGEGYLRFSYANSVENIQTALEAVRATLAEL